MCAPGARELRIMNSELRKKKAERGETCSAKRTHRPRKGKAGNGKGTKGRSTRTTAECGIEEVVSGQFSVDCLAATRRGACSNYGMRISDCGMGSGWILTPVWPITNHEPRITQKLSGRTKPFRRKINAGKQKRPALPQSEDGRWRHVADSPNRDRIGRPE